MAGRLTTHVLDVAQGRPAAHMALELWVLEGKQRTLLKTEWTNADGRTDAPLIEVDELRVGYYEMVFMVGDYFLEQAFATAAPAFLNEVPLRFGIADPCAHYHVPLLVSPWAYSTYRGS